MRPDFDSTRKQFVHNQITIRVCAVSLAGTNNEQVGFEDVRFNDLYKMIGKRQRIHVPYFGTLRGKVKAQQMLDRWKKHFVE